MWHWQVMPSQPLVLIMPHQIMVYTCLIMSLTELVVKLILGSIVTDKPTHPFDLLRKVSIQFEPYVMFVQVCTEYSIYVHTYMYMCVCDHVRMCTLLEQS